MTNNALPLIDYAALQRQTDKFDCLFDTLQALFLEQAPLWIVDLEAALAREDMEAVRQLCHKIKGGAGTLQAKAIVAGVTELSRQIVAEDAAAIVESWAGLRLTITQTIAFVHAHAQAQAHNGCPTP